MFRISERGPKLENILRSHIRRVLGSTFVFTQDSLSIKYVIKLTKQHIYIFQQIRKQTDATLWSAELRQQANTHDTQST